MLFYLQEGAFALALKSSNFPGEIVVTRYDVHCTCVLFSNTIFAVINAPGAYKITQTGNLDSS